MSKYNARYRKYCHLNHLSTLPRCQRMTAVTLSPALMKTRFFLLLRNTTLTGPTAPTAPTATCPRPRAQTNTNRPPSVEDVSLGPSCIPLRVKSCMNITGPVLELLNNVKRFCYGWSLFTISPRCFVFHSLAFVFVVVYPATFVIEAPFRFSAALFFRASE